MILKDLVINCSADDLLSSLDDSSVGAVITDPPFFISTGRSGGGEFSDPWSRVSTMEEALSEVAPIIRHSHRVLRNGGPLVVMGQGVAATVWDYLARQSGFTWMAEIVVLWHTGKSHLYPNLGSLFTRVNWYSKPGAHTFNSGEQRSIYSNVLVCKKVGISERRHPAEKPVELTNFLISLLTRPTATINGEIAKEADLIVDPFCGSGSTLVSAAICGRHWIGSDSSPEYCSIAKERVDHFDIQEVGELQLWINGRLENVR